jgi:hypothetical protein
MSLKSVDTSNQVKGCTIIISAFGRGGCGGGVENVVQGIIYNASSYVVASRFLTKNSQPYSRVYFPCIAYYLDPMLEDIGKLDWAKKVVDQGQEHCQIHLQPHMAIKPDEEKHKKPRLACYHHPICNELPHIAISHFLDKQLEEDVYF